MTTLDLNTAEPQRGFDLIPTGTIATVQMMIRNGGIGEGGWLKKSSDGGSEGLDCEFVIVDGEFAKRKIWQLLLLNGTTDGHHVAAEISRTFLRSIMESARGVSKRDVSEAAQLKRKADLEDFQNIRFVGRVYVEKSKDPNFPDKNRLMPVTPDSKQWRAVEQLPPGAQPSLPGVAATAPSKPAQAIARPQWAAGE